MDSSLNRGLYDYNTSLLNNEQSLMINKRIFDNKLLNKNNLSSVQTESELFKLNYILSRDTQSNYTPLCDNTSAYGCSIVNGGCTNTFSIQQNNINLSTKLLEPVGLLRERKTYRFEPLIFNPQREDFWLNNRIGRDTKLDAINSLTN